MSEEPLNTTNSDLYDILLLCDDEDLAPVVEVLKSSPASVLALSRAYELNQPNHVAYVDRIGDEIYRLALDAMVPKERRRPSYAAMMEAICVKIGIPVAAEGFERNEGILFNTFVPRHLESVSAAERRSVLDEMRTAASKAADGLLTVAAWPPFVACMLEIAALRRKHGYTPGSFARALGTSSRAVLVGPDEAEGSLIIADGDGTPILSVVDTPDQVGAKWQTLGPEGPMGSLLLPILKSVQPFIAADRILANGDFVRVGIEGGAAALSRSKVTGELVGSAIGWQGQVPFHAVAVGAVAWPAALLMLASAYMEQKRFENIERSLEGIISSLAEVTRFQNEERRSVLTGSIQYFRQVSRSVLVGELDDDVLHAIERHEADLIRIQNHLSKDLESQVSTMQAMKNGGWTSGKFVKALNEEMSKLEHLVEDAATCMQARACGYQLLCAFPGREARKQARLEDIAAAIGGLCPDGKVGGAIDRLLREKLKDVSSIEAKAAVLGREDHLFDRIGSFRKQTSIVMEEARRMPDMPAGPLSFTVRMQEGKPVAIALA